MKAEYLYYRRNILHNSDFILKFIKFNFVFKMKTIYELSRQDIYDTVCIHVN